MTSTDNPSTDPFVYTHNSPIGHYEITFTLHVNHAINLMISQETALLMLSANYNAVMPTPVKVLLN
jgi:hypothetical protein